MNSFIRKLKQKKGETLTEVLVGLLIACLSTAMFAAMLGSASHIIENSSEALTDYYDESEALAEQAAAGATYKNMTVLLKLEKIVSISSSSDVVKERNYTTGSQPNVELIPDMEEIKVDYYVNGSANKADVASYGIAK